MRGTPPGSRRGGRLHLSICDQASDLSCIKILLTTLLGLECRLKGVPRATDVRASLGRARMFIPTTRHQRGAAAEVEVITGCPKTGPLPPLRYPNLAQAPAAIRSPLKALLPLLVSAAGDSRLAMDSPYGVMHQQFVSKVSQRFVPIGTPCISCIKFSRDITGSS